MGDFQSVVHTPDSLCRASAIEILQLDQVLMSISLSAMHGVFVAICPAQCKPLLDTGCAAMHSMDVRFVWLVAGGSESAFYFSSVHVAKELVAQTVLQLSNGSIYDALQRRLNCMCQIVIRHNCGRYSWYSW